MNQSQSPEPEPLSPEYHKARKQVVLWSGILLTWEFLGFDVERAKAAQNVGPLLAAIKNPNYIPFVMLILVAYFAYKTTIEWVQCSPVRRAAGISQLDFFSAWVIAILSIIFFGLLIRP